MNADFKSQRVKDVMSRQVVSIHFKETLHDALELMTETRVAAIPVVDSHDHCVGIVSTSDLVDVTREVDDELFRHEGDNSPHGWLIGLLADSLGHQQIESVMTVNVASVGPESTLVSAAAEMLRNHVHRLPVVDKTNHLHGIVSTTDILEALVGAHEHSDAGSVSAQSSK